MSMKALEMDKLMKVSIRRYISSIKKKDPNISKLKDSAMKLVDGQFFPVTKPKFNDNRVIVTPHSVVIMDEPYKEEDRLAVLIDFLDKYFFMFETNSTDNLVCPLCMRRFKLQGEYTFEDIQGSTCDCPHCNGLLIVDDKGLAPFHRYVYKDTNGVWDKDGKGACYVEF